MREVGILQAKTELSSLIAEVEATGEEIVLTRHGRAAAKIVPLRPKEAETARDPAEWRRRVAKLLAWRDAQPTSPGFDDLSWEELKRIARGEDRYD